MIVATVNTDYAAFINNDDPEIIQQIVDQICDSLWMEARLRMMGYDFGPTEGDW